MSILKDTLQHLKHYTSFNMPQDLIDIMFSYAMFFPKQKMCSTCHKVYIKPHSKCDADHMNVAEYYVSIKQDPQYGIVVCGFTYLYIADCMGWTMENFPMEEGSLERELVDIGEDGKIYGSDRKLLMITDLSTVGTDPNSCVCACEFDQTFNGYGFIHYSGYKNYFLKETVCYNDALRSNFAQSTKENDGRFMCPQCGIIALCCVCYTNIGRGRGVDTFVDWFSGCKIALCDAIMCHRKAGYLIRGADCVEDNVSVCRCELTWRSHQRD